MSPDLTLNIVKLFPKAAEMVGIESLHAKISEIKSFTRLRTSSIGYKGDEIFEDRLQIGNTTYKFPAVDNGIYILSGITSSLDILAAFQDNTLCAMDDFEILKCKAAIKFIRKATLQYT